MSTSLIAPPSSLILPPAGGMDLLVPARRRLLGAAAAAVAQLALPQCAKAAGFWDQPRELWLRHAATGEEIREVYWANGQLVRSGYDAICWILRDTHRNEAIQFDLTALDIARGTYGWLQGFGMARPLIVFSGYRHPLTNQTEGGKKNSLHIQGRALDIHIEGVRAEQVGKFGQYLSGGGVGFYPGKRFTHLDSGRIRTWSG
jgi:uncharacterized protein YcbK (DUF882 family)